jgi:hypothetical protein
LHGGGITRASLLHIALQLRVGRDGQRVERLLGAGDAGRGQCDQRGALEIGRAAVRDLLQHADRHRLQESRIILMSRRDPLLVRVERARRCRRGQGADLQPQRRAIPRSPLKNAVGFLHRRFDASRGGGGPSGGERGRVGSRCGGRRGRAIAHLSVSRCRETDPNHTTSRRSNASACPSTRRSDAYMITGT